MQTIAVSKGRLWTGRILSILIVLFLLMDVIFKFIKPAPPPVIDSFAHLGWPISLAVPLGIILLMCTILYAIPRTAFVGAILLTGYLGGAIATHLRVGDPLFSQVLFPVYMGVVLWAALFLRDGRLSAFVFSQD